MPPARDPYVPIFEWSHTGSYDTVTDCNEARGKLIAKSLDRNFDPPAGETVEEAIRVILVSECVSAHDPILRRK